VGCGGAAQARAREFDIGKRVRAYGTHPTQLGNTVDYKPMV